MAGISCLIAIQTRNNSTRLPNKIHLPFGNSTVLQTLLDTCQKVTVEGVKIMYKTLSSKDDPVDGSYVSEAKIDDLVSRYYDAMNHFDVDYMVRLTSDCPLIPQNMIENVITNLKTFDYVSNVNPRTFVDGYDCQGISRKGMEWIYNHQQQNREHLFFDLEYNHDFEKQFETSGFTINRLLNPDKLLINPHRPEHKLSIDTQEDLERCQQVWEKLHKPIILQPTLEQTCKLVS